MVHEKGKKDKEVGRTMRFEDLDAWLSARTLTQKVYSLTRSAGLSKDFGLSGQLQRAAVSTMSNLAEGFERRSLAEMLHFYNIAHASNGEVRALTYVVEDNYPPDADVAIQIRASAMNTGRLVAGLVHSKASRRK